MLLNQGRHGSERILSRPSVQLMTMNHLTSPEQRVDKEKLESFFGYDNEGGWGFLMSVRTHRRNLASVGQFGWNGVFGTTAYADPAEDLVGILLTQVIAYTPDEQHIFKDFWNTAYQAIDD
ncbi:MAG: hypothetical protein ACREN8_11370, partial [Candidatus Dormibacteraceae bacterium]